MTRRQAGPVPIGRVRGKVAIGMPRLLDPAARLGYEGYVAHGLNDLIDRFVVRDGNRWTLATYVFPTHADQSSRLQTIVDEVDPAQTLTGLTVVNQELARGFIPQFIKGLAIGTRQEEQWTR